MLKSGQPMLRMLGDKAHKLAGVHLICLAGALGLAPAGAQAAFPGANGAIAYTHVVACVAAPGVNFPPSRFEIFRINPDGSGDTNLSNAHCPLTIGDPIPLESDGVAQWSPDGKKIAFGRGSTEALSGIYVMDADGSNKRQVTNNFGSEPSFSPDGSKIVFAANDDIYTVSAAGGTPTPVAVTPEVEGTPVYSPDGTKIAFQNYSLDGGGNVVGPPKIYVMNADGGGRTPITDGPANDGNPDFSPDGSKLVFIREAPPSPQRIYSIRLDRTGETRLTESEGEVPVFSPDGTEVAFSSRRRSIEDGLETGTEIYTMDADGSNEQRLTNTAGRTNGRDNDPNWQPVARAATPTKRGTTTGTGATTLAAFSGCPSLTANVIRGSAASNTITGTLRGDRIFAGLGDDLVNALAGDDCVDLGAGTDRGKGGSGSDLLLGGRGDDTLSGNSGDDRLSGQWGKDRIAGSSGKDKISGGSGADKLSGGSSADRISGGSGKDRISGGSAKDKVRGGSGDDRISVAGDGKKDRVNCGAGKDKVLADRIDVVAANCEDVVRRR